MNNKNQIFKAALFSFAIVVFAVAHTLFMRWKLPAYGPKIGTYLDDISYAMLIALILFLIFNLPLALKRISLVAFVFLIQFLVCGEWWNFEFYRDYIRYASLGHAMDWQEVARGFPGFSSRHLALGGSVVFFIMAYLLYRKSYLLNIQLSSRLLLFAGFVLLALIPTSVYSKFYIESQIDNWQKSVSIPLNYKNPGHAVTEGKIS